MTWAITTAVLDARRKQNNAFKIRKKNAFHTSILYPAKLAIKCEATIKTSSSWYGLRKVTFLWKVPCFLAAEPLLMLAITHITYQAFPLLHSPLSTLQAKLHPGSMYSSKPSPPPGRIFCFCQKGAVYSSGDSQTSSLP